MKIKIFLQAYNSKGNHPSCRIKINDRLIFDDIIKESSFVIEESITNLSDKNILTIEHYGKKNKDTIIQNEKIIEDKAIELKSVLLHDFKIPDVILYSQKFYPDYPKNIIDEYSGSPPEYIDNNLYFGYNGTYYLIFEKDIARWYYKILLLKEKLANDKNQKLIVMPNGESIETFEFAGKNVKANDKGQLTIDDLYHMIKSKE